MNRLLKWLKLACHELGLRLDVGHSVDLGDGLLVSSLARIRDLGAPNGTLIVRSYVEVERHLDKLSALGYGFSVLDEPRPDEEFDLESFRDMFIEWGWSADAQRRPTWWNS